jgi:serine protease Do
VSDKEAQYKVITNDGKQHDVSKISRDPLNDLAIIKIEGQNLKPLELADSDNIKLGQTVVAIGTPLGQFTNTVTTGIISGLGRGVIAGSGLEGSVERLDNVIQTDAAINPGNSGGPLISSGGLVVGVNTAISSSGQNIGFAIPSNVIANLIENFDTSAGQIQRPFIGIRYQMVSKEAAILNEVPEGAYIIDVLADSPAEKSELQKGDIITDFNDTKIKGENTDVLQKMISETKAGASVTITIWRDNKTIKKTLKLETYN